MAAKIGKSQGSYNKKVEDSSHQSSNKFSKYPTSVVTDNRRKPSDKGQRGSVKYSGEQHPIP